MASNGTAPVLPKTGEQTEIGTAFDRDRIWTSFNNGRIFTPYDVNPRRIDEMLRTDGKAKAIEQALTLPLRAADWTIEPAKGDSGEAEFANDALTRNSNAGGMSTPIELVISQAVSACLFRRAYFEKVWRLDPDSGRLVYDKIAFRPAATCRLNVTTTTGSFDGFRQRVPDTHPGRDEEGYVHIPAQRSFVFTYGQHRRPLEGVSDLETAFALYETKQKIKWLWMNFLENQVMPKGVAKDESGDAQAAARLARKVATLKSGGVIGLTEGQTLSAFETNNAADQAFKDAISFIDSEMYASVLAGFLELTSSAASGKGSYALANSSTDFFLQSRQAVLIELAAAIENFLLADLIHFNFGPSAAVPNFGFEELRAEDVTTAVTLLQTLAGQQNPGVPRAFIDLLTVKVAALLNLDTDQVSEAIKSQPAGTAQDPTMQFMDAIAKGTAILQQQGLPAAA